MKSISTEKTLKRIGNYREECARVKTIGRREVIAGTECIIHIPRIVPPDISAIFVLHGGAWIGGDAVMIESLCETLANDVPMLVVNINYTKLDVKPFPNPMEEVCQILSYFKEHSREYGINPEKFVLIGFSAGAHIAAGSAIMLKDRGIDISRQILVYPFTDWTGLVYNPLVEIGIEGIDYKEIVEMFFVKSDPAGAYYSPLAADDCKLCCIAPADIIICGEDVLRQHGVAYYEKLKAIGIDATLKEYPYARHGFLEVNRVEFTGDSPAKGEMQASFARICERDIVGILRRL